MIVESVDNLPIAVTGTLFKTVKVRDEPYVCITEPSGFINRLRQSNINADLFTFTQEISDVKPKYSFHRESERLAVLPVTTYEHWFKKQIDFKARNKTRKAQKSGVVLRRMELDDGFVSGVVDIYNESPVRQGKPFKHYGKSFEIIKRELSTFFESSEFVGAYYQNELIGFIKFVKGNNVASLMHIISKFAHRDKAPTNALLAKGVEMCAERKISYLHYGVWSRRGLGTFKISHGFVQHEVPRYFVPLNFRGRLMLRLDLHHRFRDYVPEMLIDQLVMLRTKWNTMKFHPVVTAGDGGKPRSLM